MKDHVMTKWLTCVAIMRLDTSKNATLLFHRFVTSEFFIIEYNFLYHVVGYLSGFRFIYSFSVCISFDKLWQLAFNINTHDSESRGQEETQQRDH